MCFSSSKSLDPLVMASVSTASTEKPLVSLFSNLSNDILGKTSAVPTAIRLGLLSVLPAYTLDPVRVIDGNSPDYLLKKINMLKNVHTDIS